MGLALVNCMDWFQGPALTLRALDDSNLVREKKFYLRHTAGRYGHYALTGVSALDNITVYKGSLVSPIKNLKLPDF